MIKSFILHVFVETRIYVSSRHFVCVCVEVMSGELLWIMFNFSDKSFLSFTCILFWSIFSIELGRNFVKGGERKKLLHIFFFNIYSIIINVLPIKYTEKIWYQMFQWNFWWFIIDFRTLWRNFMYFYSSRILSFPSYLSNEISKPI